MSYVKLSLSHASSKQAYSESKILCQSGRKSPLIYQTMQAYSFAAMCCFLSTEPFCYDKEGTPNRAPDHQRDKLKLANVSRFSELLLFTPLRCPGNIPSRECMQGAVHGHAPKNASTGLPSFCPYHGHEPARAKHSQALLSSIKSINATFS